MTRKKRPRSPAHPRPNCMTTRLGVLSQLKPFQPFLFATSLRLCQSLQLYGEAHGFLPRQAEGGGVSPQRQRSAPLALVVCQEGRGAHPKSQLL